MKFFATVQMSVDIKKRPFSDAPIYDSSISGRDLEKKMVKQNHPKH